MINSVVLFKSRSCCCLKFLYFLCFHLFFVNISAQNSNLEDIQKLVNIYKNDSRGPYKDIRWFCIDGSTISPKERCVLPGGVQRARYKDEVIALGKKHHIFLGQILSTTNFKDFWDETYSHSKIKQYFIQKYLQSVDDGWVLQKAQYYRGALQVEDEHSWGINFFNWLLENDENVLKNFFLVRQTTKYIPHYVDDSKTQNIRAVSKYISDVYPAFMNLRIKIHGQPEASDINKVKDFKTTHHNKLSLEIIKKLDELILDMELVYQPIDLNSLLPLIKKLPKQLEIINDFNHFVSSFGKLTDNERIASISNMMFSIRKKMLLAKSSASRLIFFDISNKLEELLFRNLNIYTPKTLNDLVYSIYYQGQALAACGFIEIWEWEAISKSLIPSKNPKITLEALGNYFEASRRLSEWSVAMVRATYQNDLATYAKFEPLVNGFIDDVTRSSILLNFGQSVSKLGDYFSTQASFSNKVMGIPNQSHIRGLNPGYSMGELVIVNGDPHHLEVSPHKIYVFKTPPSDLKPISGILSLNEGNLVSHVQLLARNLGIPNAVVSLKNIDDLLKHNGKKVFYAVSNKGTVIMKLVEEMSTEERLLFSKKTRSDEKIKVPINKMDLKQDNIVNIRDVNAAHSGKLCGPKAANLGQLKSMFPDKVVEGLVVPFGIFRKHMDQTIPDQTVTYWQKLNNIFKEAELKKSGLNNSEKVEAFITAELELLRSSIVKIKLLPEFVQELKKQFNTVFQKALGKTPVFIRSDTNMEDLKDFTGAGLNLTLFNIITEEEILQGIKNVWASPYTERSYKWRQQYLLNPENVFPSILIIPSVNVDYSGVMITKGITTDNNNDITIAFSKGVGGAVDGQAAESWLLKQNGDNELISPARDATYTNLLSKGGISKKNTSFEAPILNTSNIDDLRYLTKVIIQQFPSDETKSKNPFDIELGFKDNKLWLFQVRPFVENKKAISTNYLQSITPKTPYKLISVDTKI